MKCFSGSSAALVQPEQPQRRCVSYGGRQKASRSSIRYRARFETVEDCRLGISIPDRSWQPLALDWPKSRQSQVITEKYLSHTSPGRSAHTTQANVFLAGSSKDGIPKLLQIVWISRIPHMCKDMKIGPSRCVFTCL